MKKMSLLLVVLFLACQEESIVQEAPCNRETECSEYPTWQNWGKYQDGYSNYECEPCWWSHHRQQKGDCCTCSENGLEWCNSDSTGVYACTYFGEFDYYNCRSYCARFMYPYGDTCYEDETGAWCDCRFEF